MKLHFGHFLGLSAISIAGCAAFFSVYGISQLFAGAFVAVVIMASVLEFGKLAMASHLQRYWDKIGFFKKLYGVVGVVVLVAITSAGIYGFLSNAYQKTANEFNINTVKTERVESKKIRYEDELASYTTERIQLNTTINDLSKGLANNVIQYKDKETGEIITTTSSNTRRVLTAQLEDSKIQRDKITTKMEVLRDSVTSQALQLEDLKINNKAGAELGPLIYLAKITGLTMDKVVNYFILLLIFVFDPLAIALVLATNWVFEEERKKRETNNPKVIQEDPVKEYFNDLNNSLTDEERNDRRKFLEEDALMVTRLESDRRDAMVVLRNGEITIPSTSTTNIDNAGPKSLVTLEYLTKDVIEELNLNEPIVEEPIIEEPIVEEPPIIIVEPIVEKPIVEPVRNRVVVKSSNNQISSIEPPNAMNIKGAATRKFTKQIPRRGGTK